MSRMNEADRIKLLDAARDALLAGLPDARAIYVYGSFARGDEWPDSDVDLAVLLPPGDRITDLLGLVGAVTARIGRDVDLVDLRRAGDVLRREVLQDGKLLFAADADELLAWEASAMSRCAEHFENIRDILADFHKTGIGYAA